MLCVDLAGACVCPERWHMGVQAQTSVPSSPELTTGLLVFHLWPPWHQAVTRVWLASLGLPEARSLSAD